MKFRNPLIFSILLLASLLALPAFAQRSDLSVREALGIVSSRFGPESVQWVAEVYATMGIPQPSAWEVLSYDERAPRLLYRFGADSSGNARDLGIDEIRYPKDVPVGYFNPNHVRLDSVAAFTVAEGEARKARMAFDSCEYLLRAREFSQEPMWRLQLMDAGGRVAGKIYISATNGQVLRTVWVYHDERSRSDGQPLIVDSATPSQGGLTTSIDGSALPPAQQFPPRSGIAAFPPNPKPFPGQSGIEGAPPYSTPGQSQIAPGDARNYDPVDPSGLSPTQTPAVVTTLRPVMTDDSPDPPALAQPSAVAATPPPTDDSPDPPALAQPTTPSVPSASGMRDVPAGTAKQNPDKPPIDVKPGSGGSSERIPPPPIPR